jgi:hypothetical protein
VNKKEEFFEAGNLYLASYLSFRGFPFKGIKGEGKFKRILFDDTLEVHNACADFFADQELRKLFNCYRNTKDFLFQNGQ